MTEAERLEALRALESLSALAADGYWRKHPEDPDAVREVDIATIRKALEGSMMNECYRCEHMRVIPGDAHIRCDKPDPYMSGTQHGVRNGWFRYPLNFDPAWKTRNCRNFEDNGD